MRARVGTTPRCAVVRTYVQPSSQWITKCPNPPVWHRRLIPSIRSEGECWPWAGRLDKWGYGIFRYKIGNLIHVTGAHRAAYLTLVGDIGPDLTIDHLCRNTSCINPAHMEPVTMSVNSMRMWDAHGRREVPERPEPFVLPVPEGKERLRDMLAAVQRVRLIPK